MPQETLTDNNKRALNLYIQEIRNRFAQIETDQAWGEILIRQRFEEGRAVCKTEVETKSVHKL